MALATLDTCIENILLLASEEPAEIAAVCAEHGETGHNPTQHLVGLCTLGDSSHLGSMSSKIAVLAGLHTGHGIAVDDANITFSHLTSQESGQLLANLHLVVLGSIDLATSQCNGAGEVHLAGLHQAAKHDNLLSTQCPYNLALVDGVDVVDLHANVAGRSRTFEHIDFAISSTQESLGALLLADTKTHGGNLGQGGQTCLELCLLALEDILEVLSQGHAVESTHVDCLGSLVGISHSVVGTLTDHTEDTALHKQSLYIAVGLEGLALKLHVALYADTQQLATIATFHQ